MRAKPPNTILSLAQNFALKSPCPSDTDIAVYSRKPDAAPSPAAIAH